MGFLKICCSIEMELELNKLDWMECEQLGTKVGPKLALTLCLPIKYLQRRIIGYLEMDA